MLASMASVTSIAQRCLVSLFTRTTGLRTLIGMWCNVGPNTSLSGYQHAVPVQSERMSIGSYDSSSHLPVTLPFNLPIHGETVSQAYYASTAPLAPPRAHSSPLSGAHSIAADRRRAAFTIAVFIAVVPAGSGQPCEESFLFHSPSIPASLGQLFGGIQAHISLDMRDSIAEVLESVIPHRIGMSLRRRTTVAPHASVHSWSQLRAATFVVDLGLVDVSTFTSGAVPVLLADTSEFAVLNDLPVVPIAGFNIYIIPEDPMVSLLISHHCYVERCL